MPEISLTDSRLLVPGASDGMFWTDCPRDALRLASRDLPTSIDKRLRARISSAREVIIIFETSADGRGFSLARHFRLRLGYQGLLYAAGDVIPDQVRLAIDCGFDGLELSSGQRRQYGEENWLASLGRNHQLGYWSDRSCEQNKAWSKRAGVVISAEHL